MAYHRRKESAAAALSILCALAAAAPARADLPGRLFFTPEERAELDRARARGEAPPPPPVAPPPPGQAKGPAGPPPPEIITVNGVVRGRDGSSSVWINNRLRDPEVKSTPVPGDPSKVRVDLGVQGGTAELRVGQRLDRSTGRVAEPYQIPPPAPPAREAPATGPARQQPPTKPSAPDEDEAAVRRD